MQIFNIYKKKKKKKKKERAIWKSLGELSYFVSNVLVGVKDINMISGAHQDKKGDIDLQFTILLCTFFSLSKF